MTPAIACTTLGPGCSRGGTGNGALARTSLSPTTSGKAADFVSNGRSSCNIKELLWIAELACILAFLHSIIRTLWQEQIDTHACQP